MPFLTHYVPLSQSVPLTSCGQDLENYWQEILLRVGVRLGCKVLIKILLLAHKNGFLVGFMTWNKSHPPDAMVSTPDEGDCTGQGLARCASLLDQDDR